MGIRPKLIIVLLALGFGPVFLLGAFLYRESVRAVEADLDTRVGHDATDIAIEIDAALRQRETSLENLARSPALRKYVSNKEEPTRPLRERKTKDSNPDLSEDETKRALPAEVRESVRAFLLSNPDRHAYITCLDTTGKPLFRTEPVRRAGGVSDKPNNVDVEFKTENFLSSTVNADSRVWNTAEQTPLRSPISSNANGVMLRYTIPVFEADAYAQSPRGVLIAELNGNVLFDEAMTGRTNEVGDPGGASSSYSSQNFVIMLDHDGRILYHTNEALRHRQIESVMPAFKDIAGAMKAGQSGTKPYDTEDSKWLVAYRPVTTLRTSVAVAGNYTQATSRLKRLGLVAFTLLTVFGLGTLLVFTHILRNTARSIERVTEGAVAIAGGKLEQRIEVRSNDETRLLAESFNIMTDRLREQIAHETESRQFESFMRLSAMLTHDLKNAIAGLSLLVENIERQFHREEFRADAMKSLTEATDKLRRLVAKLSEPAQSLSSEHEIAREADLVPLIKKALRLTVEPAGDLHEVVVHLPEVLAATVEPDRIEKVFENLIMNALEAMGVKSGKLTIDAGHTSHGEVFIGVSDTGPGMSDEFQRVKLFRAFATTKKTGIGLGLYTCREIVQAHGGHIEVESRRGSGATFRVVLPSRPKITKSQ